VRVLRPTGVGSDAGRLPGAGPGRRLVAPRAAIAVAVTEGEVLLFLLRVVQPEERVEPVQDPAELDDVLVGRTARRELGQEAIVRATAG
jgi:hypothetical protein